MTVIAEPMRSAPANGVRQPILGSGAVLGQIDWDTYEGFLHLMEGRRIFLTYDRGVLEIMAPLFNHEWWKTRFGILLRVLCEEIGSEIQSAGSTTVRREDLARGIEADEWYYIGNALRMTGLRERIDLSRDPPPDLGLEVEGTRSALDRMGIYAALGVPEVWRYDGETLHVHCLRPDGQYEVVEQSVSFPALPLGEFAQFIQNTQGLADIGVSQAFRVWVRQHVLPRLGKNENGA